MRTTTYTAARPILLALALALIAAPALAQQKQKKTYEREPDMKIDKEKVYVARMETTEGPIVIELYPKWAPHHVNSFVFLAREGFYDGVIFHRVIPGFVIQGGDPTGTGTGGPGYKFRDELDKPGTYQRGTVAMANAGPNTNGSQFFVVLGKVGLPHAYTIFGEVTDGMDAVDAVAALQTRSERPVEDAVINRVTITES